MTIKVALYARVSTRDQTEDNQLIRMRQVAEARGYIVIDEYADVASGADARRPALDRMRRDAKAGRFSRILATKLDRLARSTVNLADLVADLDRWNVGLELLDQPIDTTTPTGRLTTVILGAVAEFERELIRDRTRDGLARAVAEGKTLGRPKRALSDYQIDKIRAIMADEPDISMRALSARMEGISRTRLAELIREEGIR